MDPGFSELIGVLGRGLIIGLVLAVPVGPIGMLCIVRTLRHGRRVGLATGLGAATADALYAGIAIFGLTALTTVLVSAQKPLTIVGALVLGLIGFRTMRAPVADPTLSGSRGAFPDAPGLRATWLGTAALTLANPATILTFVGIFAGITTAISPDSRIVGPSLLVGSVFVGSACWWVILTSAVHAVRARWFTDGSTRSHHPGSRMRLLNLLSGGVLIAFGILAAVHALA